MCVFAGAGSARQIRQSFPREMDTANGVITDVETAFNMILGRFATSECVAKNHHSVPDERRRDYTWYDHWDVFVT